MDDPLEMREERRPSGDDILNTPISKKSFTATTKAMQQTKSTTIAHMNFSGKTTTTTAFLNTTTSVRPTTATVTTKPVAVSDPQKLLSNTVSPTTRMIATPLLLNNKNMLPRASSAFPNQYIKIAPKIAATTESTISTASTPVTTSPTPFSVGGKTAVKTANGQILFIHKATGGKLSGVRLQTPAGVGQSAATTTTLGTRTGSGAASTSSGTANKTMSIQVLRATDGSIMPVKQTASSSGLVTKTVTLSPNTQLMDKKIVTTAGGHLYFKAPLKTMAATAATTATTVSSAITTCSSGGTTTTMNTPSTMSTENALKNVKIQKITPMVTVTTTTAAAAAAQVAIANKTTKTAVADTSSTKVVPISNSTNRFIVQSANGKQILVPKQSLVKLSPKPSTPGGSACNTGAGSTTTQSGSGGLSMSSGQLQAIKLTSKGGLQYVRMLPTTSKIITATGGSSSSSGTTTTASTSIATTTVGTSSGSTSASATTTTSGTVTKLLNAVPQKFTVVRPSGLNKLLLKPNIKKEEGETPVTYSPVTTKVQQTVVNLPSIDDGNKSPTTTAATNAVTVNKSGTTSAAAACVVSTGMSLVRKHKISEINSEIKRVITDGLMPPDTKKTANGNRIVVVARGALPSLPSQQPWRPTIVQRVVMQSINSSRSSSSSNNNNNNNIISNISSKNNKNSSSTGNCGNNNNTNNNSKNSQLMQSKYVYSVLKNNNPNKSAAETDQKSTQQSHQHQQQSQQHQQHKSLLLKRPMPVQMLPRQTTTGKPHAPAHKQHSQQSSKHVSSNHTQSCGSTTSSSGSGGGGFPISTITTNKFVPMKIKEEPHDMIDMKPMLEDPGTLVRRKHCNCSKSQCLKLYCDCFANGEFCKDCTCKDCFNNLQYEDERQRAIRLCLERNPSAFKPKITTSSLQGDMRLHNKGCNCKRSGCLKNYCECYEAKIPCSSNCKCVGCRNIEDRPDLDMDPIDHKLAAIVTVPGSKLAGQKRSYDKLTGKSATNHLANDKLYKDANKAFSMNTADLLTGLGSGSVAGSNTNSAAGAGSGATEKQQCNFITQEVIDATVQCMMSQADECEKNTLPAYQTEKMVMEELGRCLVEIIDFSIRNTDTNYSQD